MLVRIYLTTLFLFLVLPPLIAQDAKYKIVHLPRKTAYSKDKLNEEISAAKEKESVRKIIRQKNFPSAQLIIQINQGKDKCTWWTLHTTSGYEREDKDIILQSKTGRIDASPARPEDSTIIRINEEKEMTTILGDSVALLEPIYIEPWFNNKQVTASYKYTYRCVNTHSKKLTLPFSKGKLIISPSLINSCPSGFREITVYDTEKNSATLATFYLAALSAEQKETLLSVAEYYRSLNPATNLKDIGAFVQSYSTREFGPIFPPQLLNWLHKNLKDQQ